MLSEIIPHLFIGTVNDAVDKPTVFAAKYPSYNDVVGQLKVGEPEYLWAERGDKLYLNLVDPPTINYVPHELMVKAVDWVERYISAGDVYVLCNQGMSRSPTIAFLYMKKAGLLPDGFEGAIKRFKEIYPIFQPGGGMLQYIQSQYDRH